MRRSARYQLGMIVTLLLLATALQAQGTTSPSGHPWMVAPDILPAGALLAVVSGNPAEAGHNVIQIYMPDGYRMPPHRHPMNEHIEVVSGGLRVGIGPKMDTKKMLGLVPGDSGTAPTGAVHYSIANGPTVLEVTFDGPYTLTYVNGYDAPRNSTFPPRP